MSFTRHLPLRTMLECLLDLQMVEMLNLDLGICGLQATDTDRLVDLIDL